MSKVAGRPFCVYTNALFLQTILRVSHAKQALLILREHLGSPPDFSGVHVAPVFRVMFCRWSFVLLSFFFWPLCWLYFYDLRLLITFLVSSNVPYIIHLYLSPIVFFSSFFVLYLPPWLFWNISWLYYYTLFYSHHYYYYLGLFHDYIIIHCFIYIIITIIFIYYLFSVRILLPSKTLIKGEGMGFLLTSLIPPHVCVYQKP